MIMIPPKTKCLFSTERGRFFIARLVFWAIVLLIFFRSCTSEQKQRYYIIGFSQCVESDDWRKTMLQEMNRELAFYPNIHFIYRQADGNSQKQVAQAKELLKENIDLFIISPNEGEPLTPVVEQAFLKGIPVIVVDRKVATPHYSAYIGSSNFEIGKMAGQYAVHLLNGKGKIIEITGLPKSSPAIERHNGFIEAIKNYPSLQVVQQINGEWLPQTAKYELSKIAAHYPDVKLVFAQNDMMAQAAYEVFKTMVGIKPAIIGVDGLPSTGLKFVSDKTITATMLNPTGGEEIIRTAVKILNKENFPKENLIQTTVIDSTNVRIMQLQVAKAASLQTQIKRQETKKDL